MASTLGEPFVLASYSTSSSDQKPKGKNATYEGLTLASHCSTSKSEDGLITTAIQGDGVHVLNLTDLHPISSHNLGPTTLFTTSPVTVFCDEDGQSFRRTFAVMRRASDLKVAEPGKTVWSWREKASENLAVSQERSVMTIPIEATALLASDALPSSLIFASREGKIIRTDLRCEVVNEWSPAEGAILDKVILLPRRNCKFVPTESFSGGAFLLLIYTLKDTLHLQLLSFGQEGDLTKHKSLKLLTHLKKNVNVIDVTGDTSGYLSVLTSDLLWHSFRLEFLDGKHVLSSLTDVLRLRGFKPTPTRLLKGNVTAHSIAILSLGSSFVLLAGETDTDVPEIALLLWDIQYGVLLHQQTLQIPAAVEVEGASNAPFVPLQLIPATPTQALLLVSPSHFTKGVAPPSSLRHSVLVVPHSVPPSSTIASVLGKASSGSRWLIPEKLQRESDPKVEVMLQAVQNAVEEEKPEEADKIFFAWVNAESSRRTKKRGKQPQGQVEDGDLEMAETFTHNVTMRLVQSLLPVDAKPKTPYSPKILRYILGLDLVSNSMVNGGLLPALCFRSDWESIRLCFSHVANIPEMDLIRTLQTVMKSSPPPAEDAMAIDSSADNSSVAISPSSYLAGCMTYPTSSAPLRSALRTVFSKGEDLEPSLKIIVDWLDDAVKKDMDLSFGELATNEHGVPIYRQQKSKKAHLKRIMEPPPSLENIISFLHALLDSSFLTLLQHTPSHPLLRRIFDEQIGSQISFNDDLEVLRGTLQPFARAHTAAIADAARPGRAGGNKKALDHQEDWRKRRRRIHEQNEMALGPYQVEELVF